LSGVEGEFVEPVLQAELGLDAVAVPQVGTDPLFLAEGGNVVEVFLEGG